MFQHACSSTAHAHFIFQCVSKGAVSTSQEGREGSSVFVICSHKHISTPALTEHRLAYPRRISWLWLSLLGNQWPPLSSRSRRIVMKDTGYYLGLGSGYLQLRLTSVTTVTPACSHTPAGCDLPFLCTPSLLTNGSPCSTGF